MPTPVIYTRVAEHVGRHKLYYFGVGIGGHLAAMAAGGLLALAAVPLPWFVGELAFWWAFVVLLHWPFLVAFAYFHPTRGWPGRLARSRRSAMRAFAPSLAWSLATFLTVSWLACLFGPILVYRPSLLFGMPGQGAAQQAAAADEPQPVSIDLW